MKMYNDSSQEFRNDTLSIPIPDICNDTYVVNDQIKFYIEGVSLSVIGLIGVPANFIAFYVLFKIESNNNIFNKLLMQLLLGDSVSILFMVTDFSLRKNFHIFSLEDELYGLIWPKFIFPFIKLSITWITCHTMAITIER